MPEVTQEKRTVMYSVEENGHVARHVFPFDAEDPMGMSKLMKFVRRGFTFDDPGAAVKTGRPRVVVTGEVALARPEEEVSEGAPVIDYGTLKFPLPAVEISQSVKATALPVQETAALPDFTCSDCGKGPFKSEFGLVVHKRACFRRKGK